MSYSRDARRVLRALPRVARTLLTRDIALELDLIPLELKRQPAGKVLNWLRTESSVYFRPARPWGLPTVIQIEPTSRCNLRCAGCPVATGLERPPVDMDYALFTRLVDELRGSLLMMMLWDWGEPFVVPASYDMIAYARRAGIRVVSSTNGQLFGRGDHARRVVESGLDVLVFSVDGVTQQSYQRFRKGGKLELALEGIRRVIAERQRRGTTTPLVNLRFIVMKHNEGELPRLKALAHELGVDALTLRKYHDWLGDEENAPDDLRYRLPSASTSGRSQRRQVLSCKAPWNSPTVHSDGTVCSCYVDYKGIRPLGTLTQQSFREIWYGEAYQQLRRDLRAGDQDLPLCATCTCAVDGGDVGREANVEVLFASDLEDEARRPR